MKTVTVLAAFCFWLGCLELTAGVLRHFDVKFFGAEQYYGHYFPQRGRATEWNGPMKIPTTMQDQALANPTPQPPFDDSPEIGRKYESDYMGGYINSAVIPTTGAHPSSFIDERTGEEFLSVKYTIDSHHYRLVPQENASQRKHYAIFLGCSYTFGEGLNDSDTLPAQFARAAPSYRAYNFGFHGYSPASLLARARGERMEDFVGENAGIIIYTFIEDHVRRVVGSMRLTQAFWGSNLSFFYEGANGTLSHGGNFLTGRPWRQWIYKVLSHSQTLQLLNLDYPFRYTAEDWRLFAKVIAALRDEYLSRLPNGRFYFAFFPVSSNYYLSRLGPHLDAYQIPYLVYRIEDLRNAARGPLRLPKDSHPTLESNRIFGRQLAIDLLKESSKNIP